MNRIYFLVIVCFVYMVDYSEQKTCSSLEQDVDYKGNDLLHTFAKSADGIILSIYIYIIILQNFSK
jgi:hypothetical protein